MGRAVLLEQTQILWGGGVWSVERSGVAHKLLWAGAPGGKCTLKSRRRHKLGRETGSDATNWSVEEKRADE